MVDLPTPDDPVRIVHSDNYAILKDLPTGSVDAIISDPPYSARTHAGHDGATVEKLPRQDNAIRNKLGYEPWAISEMEKTVPELCRVASGWVVIMTDHTLAPDIARVLEACGRYVFAPLPFYSPGSLVRLSGDGPSSWTNWIIVARTAKQYRWGTLPGGYMLNGVNWQEKKHIGGKPVRLMRMIVRDYTKVGDLILDPFAGSGSTGVAAKLEGRRCLLIEKEQHFVDVIREQIHPGSRPVHEAPDGAGAFFSYTEVPKVHTPKKY